MTLNVRRVDVATVPFVVPERTINSFKVRGLSTSRLMSADIRYGVAPPDPETVDERPALKCVFDDAYTIGVCLQNECSYLHAGGRAYSIPRRRGEAHILYLAELQHVDLSAPHHTVEIILTRPFMREIAADLEVPEVSELG